MVSQEKLDEIMRRFDYIEARMAEGGGDIAQLGREYAELRPVVGEIRAYRKLLEEVEAAEAMLDDAEMRDLAREELAQLQERRPGMEAELRRALLPRDAADARPAILEIRPGTGGEEAALFAADLMRMYQRYAEGRGWTFEVIEAQESELGGIRELVALVRGDGVFARLKFESGVHRVQRVPETESGGRIHTSAATVAVLPEAEAVDVQIDPGDLRIDTMRASGAGGQHVNTTDSAVRIAHLPTGIVVTSSQKSQHRNREIAMEVLRSRLFDMERQKAHASRAEARAAMVGSGDRSERIRTYNFPQGRMTDHSIGLTLYKLDQIIGGDLDEVIDALTADAQASLLAEMDG
ncbi:MAG: peptide chain release factor 1 [Roseovarius sp.]|nr:peptide chain release factor 1 [Roseovarius sp.]